MLDPARGYDLIGDVHGCVDALTRLLAQMGYERHQGVWSHPRRQALFLGDIIDRGPHVREALHLVRDMVEGGHAHCLMGNHEFFALGWHLRAPADSGATFVREHSPRNTRVIQATLDQFAAHHADWLALLDWMQHLPLLLDAGRFRLVHACWDAPLIDELRARYPDARVDRAFVEASAIPGSFASRASGRLLRGVDLPLPDGLSMTSAEGTRRRSFRSKFWERDPRRYGDLVFQPDALPKAIVDRPLPTELLARLPFYGPDEPLLFVGHYWQRGLPEPIRDNLACLDYSAVREGRLVAYRLDDETRVLQEKFVWVDALAEMTGP